MFTAWFIVFRNQPGKHPLVDKVELEKIRRGKSSADLQKLTIDGKRKKIPYWAIMRTPAIWGIWLAALGDLVAVQVR